MQRFSLEEQERQLFDQTGGTQGLACGSILNVESEPTVMRR